MFDFILQFDQSITAFIRNNFPYNIVFDTIFSFFSLVGGSFIIWIFILLLLIIFEEKRDKKFILYFLFTIGTAFIASNYVLKNIFQRARPIVEMINNCPKDYSFPSVHATTAFAAATILSYFDKKRSFFYYAIALIISYSRVYLGCHYFLDILGGSVIGYLLTKLLLYFEIKKGNKNSPL